MDDVATLVSAVGTVVASFVALFLLRQGQADRRELREAAEPGQAAQFTSSTASQLSATVLGMSVAPAGFGI
jgi:hypothetical protein